MTALFSDGFAGRILRPLRQISSQGSDEILRIEEPERMVMECCHSRIVDSRQVRPPSGIRVHAAGKNTYIK